MLDVGGLEARWRSAQRLRAVTPLLGAGRVGGRRGSRHDPSVPFVPKTEQKRV